MRRGRRRDWASGGTAGLQLLGINIEKAEIVRHLVKISRLVVPLWSRPTFFGSLRIWPNPVVW
jgi:hypothetical protein